MTTTKGGESTTLGTWPTIPEGWHLVSLNLAPSLAGSPDTPRYIAGVKRKDNVYLASATFGEGPTPQAALAAAIAAAQEAGE